MKKPSDNKKVITTKEELYKNHPDFALGNEQSINNPIYQFQTGQVEIANEVIEQLNVEQPLGVFAFVPSLDDPSTNEVISLGEFKHKDK